MAGAGMCGSVRVDADAWSENAEVWRRNAEVHERNAEVWRENAEFDAEVLKFTRKMLKFTITEYRPCRQHRPAQEPPSNERHQIELELGPSRNA